MCLESPKHCIQIPAQTPKIQNGDTPYVHDQYADHEICCTLNDRPLIEFLMQREMGGGEEWEAMESSGIMQVYNLIKFYFRRNCMSSISTY